VISTAAVIDISGFRLLLTLFTGWLDHRERDVLRYLLEENRVLRRQLRGRHLQLTDDDRRRFAVAAIESQKVVRVKCATSPSTRRCTSMPRLPSVA
jgi:hypothetical protein